MALTTTSHSCSVEKEHVWCGIKKVSTPPIHMLMYTTDMPPTHYWCVGWQLNGLVQDGRKWLYRLIFFPSKVPEFLHVLLFFGWFALCFWEKMKSKYRSMHNKHIQQIGTRAFQPKKGTGECFFLNRKGHAKIQALLKEKKLSKKVTHDRLAPSHSIMYWWCTSQHTTIPLAVMATMHWLTYSYCYLQNALV